MRYLLMFLSMVLGVVLGWVVLMSEANLTVKLPLLALCALPFWVSAVLARPETPCRYCDRGRSWDAAHEHFRQGCDGAAFGLGSCGGVGKKLRWEVKLLRLFGVATSIPDPVAEARR